MRVAEVHLASDPDAGRWLLAQNLPDGGLVTVSAPAVTQTLAAFAVEVLRALGFRSSDGPGARSAVRSLAIALSWLKAMEVSDVVVVHADWLATEDLPALVGWASAAGVRLWLVGEPSEGDAPAARLDPWRDTTWSWTRFVSWVTTGEGARRERAAGVRELGGTRLPRLGRPRRGRTVPPALGSASALTAAAELRARVRISGRTHRALADALASLLRRYETPRSMADALPGAAIATREAGYDLVVDPLGTVRDHATWGRLAHAIDPAGPTAIALHGAGVPLAALAALQVGAVAPDGGSVMLGGRPLSVVPAGRRFVRAQRTLRLALGAHTADPLLGGDTRKTKGALVTAMAEALDAAGAEPRELDARRRLSPGEAWLHERGIWLAPRPEIGSVDAVDVCGAHALPRELRVDEVVLSHSRALCDARTPGTAVPRQRRPAVAGYTLTQVAGQPSGYERIEVRRAGEPAGELLGLPWPDGPRWFQVGTGVAPTFDRILEVLRADYPQCLPGSRLGVLPAEASPTAE